MKKRSALIALAAMLAIILTACSAPGPAQTLDGFSAAMLGKGLTVSDITEDYRAVPEIIGARSAEGSGFTVYFYECSDTGYARSMFEQNRSDFEAADPAGMKTSVSMPTHAKLFLRGFDTFYAISFINNTYLHCQASIENADAVKALFNALNY